MIKLVLATAALTHSLGAFAGAINGGDLLDQAGADFLEAQLGLGDLDFTNVSNLTFAASASTWHSDVAGYTNVVSIYDIRYQGSDYLIGGYSVIGHDGNGWSNSNPLTQDNFLFNLTLGLIHTPQTSPHSSGQYDQRDQPNHFATFGWGYDLHGGEGQLGYPVGSTNGSPYYDCGYSYGGGSDLVTGGSNCALRHFNVNGLESFVFSGAAASAPEPSVLALLSLSILGLGVSRRRRKLKA